MRIFPIVALLCLLMAGTAFAETITITAPWTQVRRTPSAEGRAIDVVYGNDTFDVLETKDGWAKVQTPRKVTGWVPTDPAAQAARKAPPSKTGGKEAKGADRKADSDPSGVPASPNLKATALSNAISLRQLGYREQAREKFTAIILADPDSAESYEATRQMLSYYLVGYLPPLQQGKVTEEGQSLIGSVYPAVLLQEAIALQGEKKYSQSARLYQVLVDRNPQDGRAFLGLLDTLQRAMAESLKNKKEQELSSQAATFKKYFPEIPLPEGVRLAQGSKG
jgi:uncharacterized protein YgiM (DUF1202 family)